MFFVFFVQNVSLIRSGYQPSHIQLRSQQWIEINGKNLTIYKIKWISFDNLGLIPSGYPTKS